MTLPPDPHPPLDATGASVAQRRRLGVFVLIDGLGYELVRDADFLPDFELRVGLRSELGPAEAVHASVLTGRPIAEHGITGRWVPAREGFDAARSRPWNLLPGLIADSGWVRGRIRRGFAERLPVTQELPLCPTRLLSRFDLAFEEEIFGEGGVGSSPSIFTRLARWGIRSSIHPGDVPEALVLEMARTQLHETGCEFLFLRLPRLGELLRRHGTAHTTVRAQLDALALQLRQLQRFAEERAEEVEFFVFGDRAALDVHGYVDVRGAVQEQMGRNGDRVLAFYDETHARFWTDDDATRGDLEACLQRIAQGRLIPEEEVKALGWPVVTSGGPSVFVLDPGLALSPNFVDALRPVAAAGYHPDLPHTLAALLGSYSPSLDVTEVRTIHDLMEATAGRILQDRA